MRSPDRGSTTGADSWTDRERSEWAARRASEASQSPPSPPYLKVRVALPATKKSRSTKAKRHYLFLILRKDDYFCGRIAGKRITSRIV
ncbi:hypothetical protein C5U37_16070 [Escherichia fergusonii]|nr:hypothetical protein C5U37_16070 [Escherichia fergusonii]